jgi:hypothetical protein
MKKRRYIPKHIDLGQFEQEIIAKIKEDESKAFVLEIYKQSSVDTYSLKRKLSLEEEKELAEILRKVGFRRVNFDTPWKQIIEKYLEDFLEFFFPQIHADIDFSKGYEILSKELLPLLKKYKIGKRYADELIKVHLKNGKEEWLLIHIEIQGNPEVGFARRMYIYNFKIYELHGREVVSLAILTDDDENYKPNTFKEERWGFKHEMKFPLVKIISYKDRMDELEKSKDPMALVVLAQLKYLEAKEKDDQTRFDIKMALIRMLYNKGFERDEVIDLFRFIDWLFSLPERFEEKVADEMLKLEEDKNMTYVTNMERLAEKRGEPILLLRLLKKKFGNIPETLSERLQTTAAIDTIESIGDRIFEWRNINEVNQFLSSHAG